MTRAELETHGSIKRLAQAQEKLAAAAELEALRDARSGRQYGESPVEMLLDRTRLDLRILRAEAVLRGPLCADDAKREALLRDEKVFAARLREKRAEDAPA